MKSVTVIGGGLGGLAAAITAAEMGASVTLHEAHRTLGGRWRSTPVRKPARPRLGKDLTPPRELDPTDGAVYRAHEGPHVIYRDGPIWPWLRERGLLGVACGVPLSAAARFSVLACGAPARGTAFRLASCIARVSPYRHSS